MRGGRHGPQKHVSQGDALHRPTPTTSPPWIYATIDIKMDALRAIPAFS